MLYFELGIFTFNLYVYYLTRGFTASTRAFSLPTYAFNLVTRGFSYLVCAFEILTRRFDLVIRRFELITCKSKLVTRILLFHEMLNCLKQFPVLSTIFHPRVIRV